jgi:hypothetical protein
MATVKERSNMLIPMQNPSAAKIVLASSSVYRQRLLDRVLDDYETVTPGVDESADIDDPEELAAFLARQKAEAVSSAYRDALIIGADQLAVLDGQILGKPGDHQKAVEQLLQASGKAVQLRRKLQDRRRRLRAVRVRNDRRSQRPHWPADDLGVGQIVRAWISNTVIEPIRG